VIELDKVSYGYGGTALFSQLSLALQPGSFHFLTGPSGAGKTTLLDVVAARKTSGSVEGEITVNGRPQDAKSFARVAAYVEQLDVHQPLATVAEAVRFSAALRLDADDKDAFCDFILDQLELGALRHRQVGVLGAGGLSFDQRKKLGVAVEVASNPAVLFLDEPTSGLDARAALSVIQATRRLSKRRAVLCTVHQ